MSSVVWKYVFSTPKTIVSMPKGSEFLHAGLDPYTGEPAMWFKVDPGSSPVSRTFQIVGTGQLVPKYSTYLGSVKTNFYVWHMFEVYNYGN